MSTPVKHPVFGEGNVMDFAHGVAKVKFKRKGQDGKFIRSVAVEYLTGEKVNWDSLSDVPNAYRRSPDATAAERAMRDFLIGLITHNGALSMRGFHGLLTIGWKACRGLSMPNADIVEVPRLRTGARRTQVVKVDNQSYDQTVDYIMLCMNGDAKGRRPNCRYMYTHIRNRLIDAIRKANAQKRRRPPTVTYLDAMGTFREPFDQVSPTPNHRCHQCRKAFYAKRKDAKYCSEACEVKKRRSRA